jgi:hypothetical protein
MRRGPHERGRPDAGRGHAVEAFLRALEEGDLARLIRVVGPNPRVVVDTGEADGDTSRAEGAEAGWCLLYRALGLGSPSPLSWESRAVNGGPGLVGRRSGRVVTIVVLSGSVGEITDVWIVANREKLRHWNPGRP